MQNRAIILITIFVFALVAGSSGAVIAKGQSPQPKMYQDLNDMSAMLGDISAQLSTGQMTPEAQKTAAKITHEIGDILKDIANLGNEIHNKHQTEIKKMQKSWDPFAEESATHD